MAKIERTIYVGAKLPAVLVRKLREMARNERRSVTQQIVIVLEKWLQGEAK